MIDCEQRMFEKYKNVPSKANWRKAVANKETELGYDSWLIERARQTMAERAKRMEGGDGKN